ncbi:MAG: hypothetical protein ACYCYO_13670 [Bacilli bacterium]
MISDEERVPESGIRLENEELDEVRKTLRFILGSLHPDSCGEKFNMKEYERVENSIAILDKSRALQTSETTKSEIIAIKDEMRSLVTFLQSQSESKNHQMDSDSLREETSIFSDTVDASIKKTRRKLLPYKISSSSVAVAVTSLWFFPSWINSNPALHGIVRLGSYPFMFAWLFLLICVAIIWIWAKILESNQIAIVTKLKSESYQNNTFGDYIKYYVNV